MPCAHRVHTECIQRSYLVRMNVPVRFPLGTSHCYVQNTEVSSVESAATCVSGRSVDADRQDADPNVPSCNLQHSKIDLKIQDARTNLVTQHCCACDMLIVVDMA